MFYIKSKIKSLLNKLRKNYKRIRPTFTYAPPIKMLANTYGEDTTFLDKLELFIEKDDPFGSLPSLSKVLFDDHNINFMITITDYNKLPEGFQIALHDSEWERLKIHILFKDIIKNSRIKQERIDAITSRIWDALINFYDQDITINNNQTLTVLALIVALGDDFKLPDFYPSSDAVIRGLHTLFYAHKIKNIKETRSHKSVLFKSTKILIEEMMRSNPKENITNILATISSMILAADLYTYNLYGTDPSSADTEPFKTINKFYYYILSTHGKEGVIY